MAVQLPCALKQSHGAAGNIFKAFHSLGTNTPHTTMGLNIWLLPTYSGGRELGVFVTFKPGRLIRNVSAERLKCMRKRTKFWKVPFIYLLECTASCTQPHLAELYLTEVLLYLWITVPHSTLSWIAATMHSMQQLTVHMLQRESYGPPKLPFSPHAWQERHASWHIPMCRLFFKISMKMSKVSQITCLADDSVQTWKGETHLPFAEELILVQGLSKQ